MRGLDDLPRIGFLYAFLTLTREKTSPRVLIHYLMFGIRFETTSEQTGEYKLKKAHKIWDVRLRGHEALLDQGKNRTELTNTRRVPALIQGLPPPPLQYSCFISLQIILLITTQGDDEVAVSLLKQVRREWGPALPRYARRWLLAGFRPVMTRSPPESRGKLIFYCGIKNRRIAT